MTVRKGKGKAVIKAVAVREAEDDKMLKGANAGDIYQFLCYVQQRERY